MAIKIFVGDLYYEIDVVLVAPEWLKYNGLQNAYYKHGVENYVRRANFVDYLFVDFYRCCPPFFEIFESLLKNCIVNVVSVPNSQPPRYVRLKYNILFDSYVCSKVQKTS